MKKGKEGKRLKRDDSDGMGQSRTDLAEIVWGWKEEMYKEENVRTCTRNGVLEKPKCENERNGTAMRNVIAVPLPRTEKDGQD